MIRIILLRLFIAWWMIPAIWTIVFALAYLISGYNNAKEGCWDITKVLWNGEEDKQ